VNRKPGNYAVGDTRFFEFEWFKSVVDPSLQLDCCRDEWVIRWGFYYETDREGDFIVLGPTGGVLVLEVKGGDLRKLSTTGRWEGSTRDHPVAQLSAEWRAVIEARRESVDDSDVPFVAKALCLPDLDIDPKIPSYKEIDRNLIVDSDDPASFEGIRLTNYTADHGAGRTRQ